MSCMKRLARLSNLHGLRDLPPCGNDSDAAEPAAVVLFLVSTADGIFLLLIAAGGITVALAAASGIIPIFIAAGALRAHLNERWVALLK